jgi:hypothetical protein
MKIMVEHVTNRVSTITIYDGRCILTGRALKQLFKAHYPDSRLSDESRDWKGQPNLNVNKCQMNGAHWNLSRSVNNQSKIKQSTRTSKPLK